MEIVSIILAAGKGKRMKSLLPKALHKVAGKTLLSWLEDTLSTLKKYTDRPIKVRQKPRGRGTSGPSEAKTPIEEDLKDAFACVTSCSISAVESICNGVPVFCHEKSFAKPIGEIELSKIENPKYIDPYQWLCSLAYQQFTPEEIENGLAVKMIERYY